MKTKMILIIEKEGCYIIYYNIIITYIIISAKSDYRQRHDKRRKTRDYNGHNSSSGTGVFMNDFIEEIMVELSHDLIHHFDNMPVPPPSYQFPAYPIYNPLQSMGMMPPMNMMSSDIGFRPPYFAPGFALSDNTNDDDDEIFQQQLLDQMNSTKNSATANANVNDVNSANGRAKALTTDEETFARGYGAILGLKTAPPPTAAVASSSSSSSSSGITSTLPSTAASQLPPPYLNPFSNPYGAMQFMPYMNMMGNFNINSDPNNTDIVPNTYMQPTINPNDYTKNKNDNDDSNNDSTKNNLTEDGDNTT